MTQNVSFTEMANNNLWLELRTSDAIPVAKFARNVLGLVDGQPERGLEDGV